MDIITTLARINRESVKNNIHYIFISSENISRNIYGNIRCLSRLALYTSRKNVSCSVLNETFDFHFEVFLFTIFITLRESEDFLSFI